MTRPDYLSLLQFGEHWLQWGLLSLERLEALGREFESSHDKNSEHYRFRAFHEYLASHRPLTPEIAEAFYTLGERDPHPSMGGAIMSEIIGLPECPDSLRARASASGEKHLVSQIGRLALLAELDRGLTPGLFERCLLWPDPTVHRVLAERPELSRPQLQRLAESGAIKAVRNLAAARLRSKR